MSHVQSRSIVSAAVLAASLVLVGAAQVNTFVPRRQEPSASGLSSAEGNADRGKLVFEKRCAVCHAIGQNREGPPLRGVFGRMSGSVANYAYSTALKNAHIVWNEETLEQWLTDPDILVPGNNMEFRVAKPQERQDLIRYLHEGLDK
jgi:cytochrome c